MKTVKIPPDGGFGWAIVLANALSSLIVIPMMQSFGLIFKDAFVSMGLSATEGSLIINLNAAFGMLMGVLNGVLLKVFGYRKVAMAAACLTSVGIVLTSFAKTFSHFIISYGLITSLGFGMNLSAYSLALNCYFKKNKGKATGYAMTITGLGPVLMPQLINGLIEVHTVQGVTLILGAVAAHTFVAASLLQPVKWHMKTVVEEEAIVLENQKEECFSSKDSLAELENGPVYGMDSAFNSSMLSIPSVARSMSMESKHRKTSVYSVGKTTDTVYDPDLSIPIKKNTGIDRLIRFFDLDLLKDPIYVNIMVGMSLAIFAEINFSVLTAFILNDFGLNTNQIATFMSILGIADIVFRFLAPYVGQLLKLTARPMYVVCLFCLMASRFSLLISSYYPFLLGVAVGLGVAKGLRTVYMSLVIPTYVPIEKLPSASGIQMMVNGLCILIGGPLIGIIRDVTGSYKLCIVAMNMVTMSTVVLWTIEAVIVKIRNRNKVKVVEFKEILQS